MKKILLALAAVATIFAGCNKGLEDRVSNLENRVSEIEALLTELDVRVKGINTIVSDLQKNVYVTDVKPVEENGDVIGYTLTFTEGEPVTIYHGQKGDIGATGEAGSSLTIDWFDADGEGPEDGDWYWKKEGGNWLTDNEDNKIPAVKPLDFEIKEGVLWVKVGNVEEELGSVHGDSWFDDVVVDNEAGTVTIVIPGASQELVLPFNPAAADGFALELQLPGNTDILLGGTINIGYTLTGCAAADAAVFVQAPEDWKVELNESAQRISLTVGEKAGRVVVYAINNVTGEVRAKFVAYDPATMLVVGVEKSNFQFNPRGGEFTIPVSTGIAYKVDNSSWLTVTKAPATKAVEHTVLTVTAGENTTANTLKGEVNLWTADGSKLLLSLTVEQKNYNPALLFDGEGNPIKWQETFSLKKGSDIRSFKNDVTIELSDDFAKGTYKIKNMFKADNYWVDGGSLSGAGAEYYADVEDNTMTVYVDKTPKPSYYFADEIVTLTVDLENMKLTATSDISATLAYLNQDSVILSEYTIEIPAPAQEGGHPLAGEWKQSSSFGNNNVTSSPTTVTITVDNDKVTIEDFVVSGAVAVGTLNGNKITVKASDIQGFPSTYGPVDSDVVITISDDNSKMTASGISTGMGYGVSVTSWEITKSQSSGTTTSAIDNLVGNWKQSSTGDDVNLHFNINSTYSNLTISKVNDTTVSFSTLFGNATGLTAVFSPENMTLTLAAGWAHPNCGPVSQDIVFTVSSDYSTIIAPSSVTINYGDVRGYKLSK